MGLTFALLCKIIAVMIVDSFAVMVFGYWFFDIGFCRLICFNAIWTLMISLYISESLLGCLAKGMASLMSKGSIYVKEQLVRSLGQLCQQHISYAFKKFYELCSSSLVDMAAHAQSNRLQALYLDSQRLLKTQRSVIETATQGTVEEHFAELHRQLSTAQTDLSLANSDPEKPGSDSSASSNLKLLGHEDLEVMIALDNCSSRVREELRSDLHQLEGRLKTLIESSAPLKILPMSPDAILEAFVAGLDADMIAIEVQLELVRMFDLSCFDKSYTEMLGVANQILEDGGFSPAADIAAVEEASNQEVPNRVPPNQVAPNQVPPNEEAIQSTQQPQSTEQSTQAEAAERENSQALSSPEAISSGADKQGEVREPEANYLASAPLSPSPATEPLGNTRVQTELLAKITSMLENAERESGTSLEAGSESHAQSNPDSSGDTPSKEKETNPNQTQPQKLNASKPCMDKPQLLAEINRHMNDLIANRTELLGNGQITRELSAAIKGLAEGDKGSRMHRNDLSVFQVVENVFSSFGQSMVVAPEVQQVINRCELPMLKLAIKKPLILEQDNHPIRRLFNEMAKYAIGLEQGDCEDNQIYQQMLKLSESMVGESFDEHKLPKMLSEFMAVIDRDKHQTSLSEKREVEQIAAQEKVNWARTRVEEEITRRIVGKKLSETVIDFIQRSWCMVMHMAHLRSGEAGSDWLVAIKLLENLVYLARRKATEEDVKYRHELLAHIDARLGHIATDVAQRALQIKQLAQALGITEPSTAPSAVITEIKPRTKKSAKGIKPRGDIVGDHFAAQNSLEDLQRILVSAVKAELPGRNISQAVREAESLDSSAQRILMVLHKGCWIDLGGDIKAHKRGKLAGIVGPSWKYVFVDNKGKLIAERDRARLAMELMDGKVTVLDNSHLFDKAIKQAITQIKGLPVAS